MGIRINDEETKGRKAGNEDDLGSVLNLPSGSPILYSFKQEYSGNSVKEYSLLWSPSCVDKVLVRLGKVGINASNNNSTKTNNGNIPTIGIGKTSLWSRYNTPRWGVVGLPGDGGDDHGDNGGAEQRGW